MLKRWVKQEGNEGSKQTICEAQDNVYFPAKFQETRENSIAELNRPEDGYPGFYEGAAESQPQLVFINVLFSLHTLIYLFFLTKAPPVQKWVHFPIPREEGNVLHSKVLHTRKIPRMEGLVSCQVHFGVEEIGTDPRN